MIILWTFLFYLVQFQFVTHIMYIQTVFSHEEIKFLSPRTSVRSFIFYLASLYVNMSHKSCVIVYRIYVDNSGILNETKVT